MRRLEARYAGQCAGCGGAFGRGATVHYQPALRGRGKCYCQQCGGQWSRDIAADDFDLANNRSM